ncbi:L-lactate dehydrogenase [Vibrio sp. JCM 19236]|nr:L-lactate dehydrogenase [Vibrio sp. JCM 19236]
MYYSNYITSLNRASDDHIFPTDFRLAAKRKLPPFLFHYIDGGAYKEDTLANNCDHLSTIALKQRVLKDMSELSLSTELFGEKLAMPIALGPVGLSGMYARRGEVQAARAPMTKVSPIPYQPYQSVQSRKSPKQ